MKINRYTDEEYDQLEAQFFQLQKALSETRSALGEKDLEISQLEVKIEFLSRNEADLKRRFAEERTDLEKELENVLARERQLRNQLSSLENESYLTNTKTDDAQFGIQLYQQ
jgi:chromosome segregation ATPase